MSFILDALKKSESDRQRQSGPALFEVKVAPPKSGFPVWAIAIVALLVVNMIIVGWMLLRRTSHGENTTAANTPPAAASATSSAAGAVAPPASSAGAAAGGTTAPPFNTAPPGSPPPGGMSPGTARQGGPPAGYPPPGGMSPGNMSANSTPPASGSPTGAPQSSAPGVAQQQSWPPPNQQGMGTTQGRMPERDQNEPTLAGNPAQAGNAREAGGANEPAANPDDYAPAAEPSSSMFKGHVRRGTESGLVLYQDAALTQGANLPQLRLDLHVYAAKPQDRFALINMHRMHEGDSLQGGVRVDEITPDGVVMSHNGSKFLLPRE
jgi:general secretion pathway protein B